MVFIDPPFGILGEDWDEKWSDKYWKALLRTTATNWTRTPLVLFLSYEMWSALSVIFASCGYKYQWANTWFKSNYVFLPTKGSPGYCCNLIVIFSVKPLVWNSHQADEWPATANGNLLVVPGEPKELVDGVAINSTQKPIALIRALMWRQCPKGRSVVDLCSGSGSVACAAASLGSPSFSVDIRRNQIDGAKSRLSVFCSATPSCPPVSEAFNFKALQRTPEGVVEVPRTKSKALTPQKKTTVAVPQPILLCESEDEEEDPAVEEEARHQSPNPMELSVEDEEFLSTHVDGDQDVASSPDNGSALESPTDDLAKFLDSRASLSKK